MDKKNIFHSIDIYIKKNYKHFFYSNNNFYIYFTLIQAF